MSFQGTVKLVDPTGKTLSSSASFPASLPEAPSLHGFALGVPTTAKPGAYSLSFTGTEKTQKIERHWTIMVTERSFPEEKISLTPALNALVNKPDPIKETQSKQYVAILWTFNPDVLYLKEGFIIPTLDKRRSSGFGDKRLYTTAATGSSKAGSSTGVHPGIDFAAPKGTPVHAAGSGRVALAMNRIISGNTVILEHFPGVYTIYMHMDSLAVKEGSMVGRGDVIGTVGSTGFSTGPHLHWELRVAYVACDPEALMGESPLDKISKMIRLLRATEGR